MKKVRKNISRKPTKRKSFTSSQISLFLVSFIALILVTLATISLANVKRLEIKNTEEYVESAEVYSESNEKSNLGEVWNDSFSIYVKKATTSMMC